MDKYLDLGAQLCPNAVTNAIREVSVFYQQALHSNEDKPSLLIETIAPNMNRDLSLYLAQTYGDSIKIEQHESAPLNQYQLAALKGELEPEELEHHTRSYLLLITYQSNQQCRPQ
ncbi:hypothetical protein [Aliagarivorans taiwanensis]|uniref:hypothetical protein n=1 Tax=Aliagarivorans taiwanensis TaxID=561966 RepID=UPI00047BA1F0|nr:hypothetical protein [Aliagarivorans taiwanensis]